MSPVLKYWDETTQQYLELGLRGIQGPPGPAGTTLPAGLIMPYGGDAAPTGWLLCDGSAVLRASYTALFAVVGTRYGAGDGSTTFNLPNLQDRVPVGASASKASGSLGGEATHTLSVAETPSHNHGGATAGGTTGGGTSGNTDTDHYHAGTSNAADRSLAHDHNLGNNGYAIVYDRVVGGGSYAQLATISGGAGYWSGTGMTNGGAAPDHLHSFTTNWQSQQYATNNHSHSIPGLSVPGLGIPAQGGGGAHNNLQPYVALNFLIKY